MAIDPSALYGAQIDTSDSDYPLGKAKVDIIPGDGNGTPLHKDWLNDHWGFQQALLASVGASPSGSPDKVGSSQYLEALRGGIAPISGELAYVDSSYAASPKARTTRVNASELRDAQTGSATVEHDDGVALLKTNYGVFICPIRLPVGAEITTVRALVDPGLARSGSSRMLLQLMYCDGMSFDGPLSAGTYTTHLTSSFDDATGDLQVISVAASHTITGEEPLMFRVTAGATAATNTDRVHGFEIDWNDPGPRNN